MRGVAERGMAICSAEEVGEEERSVSEAEEVVQVPTDFPPSKALQRSFLQA